MPSKRETLTVVVIMALFLLLTGIFIGLRSEHLLMAVLYLVLFFAGLPTRKLAVALLPFAIFGISYDWMRICPNYEVNPIDVAGLYHLEKSLFGVMDNGLLVTPCEYFAAHLAFLLSCLGPSWHHLFLKPKICHLQLILYLHP